MTLRHLIAVLSALLLGGAALRYLNRDDPDSQTDPQKQ